MKFVGGMIIGMCLVGNAVLGCALGMYVMKKTLDRDISKERKEDKTNED